MKILKNWKIIFIVSILLIESMLFCVLLAESLKLPSEEWSREFVTEKIDLNSSVVYEIIYPKIYTTGYNDQIINVFYSEGKVTIKVLDATLNELDRYFIDVDFVELSNFVGFIDEDELILYLISKDRKKINQLVINLSTTQLKKSNTYENEIKLYSFYNKYSLITKDDELILWDGENTKIISNNNNIEMLAFYVDNKDFNVFLIESVMGSERRLGKYIIKENKVEFVTTIGELENGSNLSLNQIEIFASEDNVKILTKIRWEKFSQNFINIFSFNNSDNEIILEYKFDNQMSMSNSKLVYSEKDEIKFIQSYPISIGMTGIGKKDEKYFNLFLESHNQEGVVNRKLLTRTVNLSNHPNYFQLEGFDYLQWLEIEQGQNVILFASNNPELVSKSKQLTIQEIINSFGIIFSINIIMSYLFLFVSFSILLPTMLAAIFIFIIYFKWATNNQKKIFSIAILIHILSKFYYVNNFLQEYGDVFDKLPGVLNNMIFQYGIAMFTTVIAYYCLRDFSKGKYKEDFLVKYLFFVIIDIFLLVLLLLPYRML